MKQGSRTRNRRYASGTVGHEASPSRRAALGEATLIAGVTAVAYMVALAYRVGGLMRLQLPLSLATVRLTDAAVAGLLVLVGGFVLFMLFDALESWRAGTLARLWIGFVAVVASAFLLVASLVVIAFLFTVWRYAGPVWAGMVSALILVGASALVGALVRALSTASSPAKYDLVFARALDRHPVIAGSIFLSFVLCSGAFYLGSNGISLGRTSYLRTQASDEVAISLSEDRALLAGIEPTYSDDATLTGSLRVVPLPSEEIVFSSRRVRELRPPAQ